MNEPGHTKVIEETTKTTYITSTSIVNEEIHLVEDNLNKNANEQTAVAKVNKTIVEVKGADVKDKRKSRSRSSSSSSSSSEDESNKKEEIKEALNNDPPMSETLMATMAHNTQTTDECIIVSEQSEKDVALDPIPVPEIKSHEQEKADSSSSSSSDEESDKEVEKPKSDNEIAVEISSIKRDEISNVEEKDIEIPEKIEEDNEEEVESKRKASLIQAEVKVVPEPDDLQEENVASSSSSSSSSDNEEEESTNMDSAKVEETEVPSVLVVDEDCPITNTIEEEETPITVTENNATDPGRFALIL